MLIPARRSNNQWFLKADNLPDVGDGSFRVGELDANVRAPIDLQRDV